MANNSTASIDTFRQEFETAFQSAPQVLLLASPGSGKTSRVPQWVAELVDKEVWVLEPRRIAAISSAHYIAKLSDTAIGEHCGYQVRLESQYQPGRTRILFLTEALLARRMLTDPDLKKVACIIIDEFHERSVHTDLALGLAKELQALTRPDLKIVIMSATLNPVIFKNYLPEMQVLEFTAPPFPLDVHYSKKSHLLTTGPDFIDRVADEIIGFSGFCKKSTLVFLPGKSEIKRLRSKLFNRTQRPILMFHGSLSLDEQRKVLEHKEPSIILATNIAESSLTLPNVDSVIDSGLERSSVFNSDVDAQELRLQKISLFSAVQRSGRAARIGPGACLRLWTKNEERGFAESSVPEILRSNLCESVWLLSLLNINAETFSWFELPKAKDLKWSVQFLKKFGFLNENLELTQLGLKASQSGLSLRLAPLMVLGEELGLEHLSARLSAYLEDLSEASKDSNREDESNSDVMDWLEQGAHLTYTQKRREAQLLKNFKNIKNCDFEKVKESQLHKLLVPVFKDRLAQRRKPRGPKAVLRSGEGVDVSASRAIKADYFLALDLFKVPHSRDWMSQVLHGLRREDLDVFFKDEQTQTESIEEQNGSLKKITTLQIGRLELSRTEDKVPQAQIAQHLTRWAQTQPEEIAKNHKEIASLFLRLQFLKTHDIDLTLNWNDFCEAFCYGVKNQKELWEKSINDYLDFAFSNQDLKILNQEAPIKMQAPSGRTNFIQYSAESAHVEFKIQDLYDLTKHPLLAQGKYRLKIHLLAPSLRVTQITQDIEGFWTTSYPEIRKELKGRYPRQDWR